MNSLTLLFSSFFFFFFGLTCNKIICRQPQKRRSITLPLLWNIIQLCLMMHTRMQLRSRRRMPITMSPLLKRLSIKYVVSWNFYLYDVLKAIWPGKKNFNWKRKLLKLFMGIMRFSRKCNYIVCFIVFFFLFLEM